MMYLLKKTRVAYSFADLVWCLYFSQAKTHTATEPCFGKRRFNTSPTMMHFINKTLPTNGSILLILFIFRTNL